MTNQVTKKFELMEDDCIEFYGRKLYRIRALRDFDNVKKGDIGGYIEKEDNLSHEGNCWIYDDAKVYDNTHVSGVTKVYNSVKVCGCNNNN